MKILRSIAAVVVGWVVAVIFILGIETVNALIYLPEGKTLAGVKKEFDDCSPWAKEWVQSLPTLAHALLQVGWGGGAFLGGAVSAWIAGRRRLLHAGIIGALVLAGTMFNFFQLKAQLDYVHPVWLIITGLLLPVPLALLAGMMVARFASSTSSPPLPQGTIREGEPPLRSS